MRALELYQNGDLAPAERLLKKILRRDPQQADSRHLLGLIAFQRGRFEHAVKQIRMAASLAPDNATFFCNLGAAQLEAGAPDDAIASYEKAIALRPNYPRALANLGLAYGRVDEFHKAEAAHRAAVKIVPEDASIHFNLANCLVALGRDDEAIDSFRDALHRNRNYGEARSNLASIHRGRGEFALALQQLDDAVRQEPENFSLRYNLANTLHQAGRLDAAQENYLTALKLDPGSIEARINLAAVLVDLARPGEAVEIYRECCETRPNDVALRGSLASLLEQINQLSDAWVHLRAGLELAPDDSYLRLLEARFARREGDIEGCRDRLHSLQEHSMPPEVEAEVALELGAVLDRVGAWEDAYSAFVRGNLLTDSLDTMAHYDLARYRRSLTENGIWFDRKRVARIPPPTRGSQHHEPIFFVGFPRSGTTLVEQILASHPDVETSAEANLVVNTIDQLRTITGRNEPYPRILESISGDQIDALRQHYWRRCGELGWLPEQRWVDKLPLNIVHLGFVRLIFPRAKILVALRDPRDVVLSCFMQSFRPNVAMAHFSRIESTIDFYVAVMRLWIHFREALDADWMEYRYEDLIADPEAMVRKILKHLELDWTDDVLDHTKEARRRSIATPSYIDVTQPINARAIGRWRNYRAQLGAVLDKLDPFITTFLYEPA